MSNSARAGDGETKKEDPRYRALGTLELHAVGDVMRRLLKREGEKEYRDCDCEETSS